MNLYSSRIVAMRTTQSFLQLGKFLRKVNYFRKRKITISRKGLIGPEFQKLDMMNHIFEPYNKLFSTNFWILYMSFLSFSLGIFFGLILNDENWRYFLYTRYPMNMKRLDACCKWVNEKINYMDKNYLFFMSGQEMTTPEGYNKNMKKIKNILFKVDEKKKESQVKHEILKQEAKTTDAGLETFDKILKENEKTIIDSLKES